MLLKDKNIVITRPREQSTELARQIAASGGKPIHFPTIKITATTNMQPCDDAIKHIDHFDWIIFTSANGVRYFMNRVKEIGAGKPSNNIAVIGSRTLAKLKKYHLGAELVPDDFSARGLLKAFAGHELKNQNILIPTSNLAGDELSGGLKKQGANVCVIAVYRTEPNDEIDKAGMIQMIKNGAIDCFIFFSPSAFRFFANILGPEIVAEISAQKTTIAAIGPVTAKTIEDIGLQVQIIPEQNTGKHLFGALEKYFTETTIIGQPPIRDD